MKRWLFVAASAATLIEGCQAPKAAPATNSPDSLSARPAVAMAMDTTRAAVVPRLLTPGDTFDLRVVGGIVIGSPKWDSLPCEGNFRTLSEMIVILGPQDYLDSKVREKACNPTAVETVGYASPYEIAGDSVHFRTGDGDEVFFGPEGAVVGDSLFIRDAVHGPLGYSRRHAAAHTP